jgi:hypothetical protein
MFGTIGDLLAVFQGLIELQWALFKALGEGFAFDTLHHQIIHPVLMACVIQHADVRMIQLGDRLGFAFKPLLANWIRGELRRRILIATVRSSRVSRARYTSPMPPAPGGAQTS